MYNVYFGFFFSLTNVTIEYLCIIKLIFKYLFWQVNYTKGETYNCEILVAIEWVEYDLGVCDILRKRPSTYLNV